MTGSPSNKGFTLIEVLISVTVFVVVVSMGAVLFITTTNAQRKAMNQEKLVRDVRQSIETISRLARMYPVDYTAYNDAGLNLSDEGVDVLYLSVGGQTVSFTNVDGQIFYNTVTENTALTSAEVEVDRMHFYISPIDSNESNDPQRVTVVFEASRQGDRGAADSMSVETSLTARWYGGGGTVD